VKKTDITRPGPWPRLPRRPAPHPLTDLAFLDGVIVPHQVTQGGHEFSEPRHALCALFLPQADRLQHEAFWIQADCSEVIRAILGEHLGGMNYFRSQHEDFCGLHARRPVPPWETTNPVQLTWSKPKLNSQIPPCLLGNVVLHPLQTRT